MGDRLGRIGDDFFKPSGLEQLWETSSILSGGCCEPVSCM